MRKEKHVKTLRTEIPSWVCGTHAYWGRFRRWERGWKQNREKFLETAINDLTRWYRDFNFYVITPWATAGPCYMIDLCPKVVDHWNNTLESGLTDPGVDGKHQQGCLSQEGNLVDRKLQVSDPCSQQICAKLCVNSRNKKKRATEKRKAFQRITPLRWG